MAAGAWQFTNAGRTSLFNGDFDIDSDTFKMALFLSTSNIGSTARRLRVLQTSTPPRTVTRRAALRSRSRYRARQP